MKTTINGSELEFNKAVTITKVSEAIGDFVIPDEIDGCRVTGIEREAFRECRSLTSVTIPGSIVNIGNGAFSECNCLDLFVVEEGNARYKTVQGLLIEDEGTLVAVPGTLTSVDIPDCVTKIGDCAFFNCEGLRTVTIPDSVTSIGENAFCGCNNLTNVTIPASVKSIGNGAFSFCDKLLNVTILDGVKVIGSCAFFSCKSLTELKFPGSIDEIGDSAFGKCFELKRLVFTDGVGNKNISENAFEGCEKLRDVKFSNSIMNILKVANKLSNGEFPLNGAVPQKMS